MFKFFILSLVVSASSIALGSDTVDVNSYSLCKESHYNNLGVTKDLLFDELNQVLHASSHLAYLEFLFQRDQKKYRVRKPIAPPELALRQIGQQEYWICLKISEQ